LVPGLNLASECVRYLVFKEPPPLGDSTRIPKSAPPCQGLAAIFLGGHNRGG